jgi:hypothetical protein
MVQYQDPPLLHGKLTERPHQRHPRLVGRWLAVQWLQRPVTSGSRDAPDPGRRQNWFWRRSMPAIWATDVPVDLLQNLCVRLMSRSQFT